MAEPADNQAGTQTITAVADDGGGPAPVPALVWGLGSALVIAAGAASAVVVLRKKRTSRHG